MLALVADWTTPLGAIGSTVLAEDAGAQAARERLLGDLMALATRIERELTRKGGEGEFVDVKEVTYHKV